jgi:hypothetical protein
VQIKECQDTSTFHGAVLRANGIRRPRDRSAQSVASRLHAIPCVSVRSNKHLFRVLGFVWGLFRVCLCALKQTYRYILHSCFAMAVEPQSPQVSPLDDAPIPHLPRSQSEVNRSFKLLGALGVPRAQ